MRSERNPNQIIRKDARNCFVESLSDAFGNSRAHFVFATYDLNKPAGQRQTNNIHIYISIPELLELCRKLSYGELRYILQKKKQTGKLATSTIVSAIIAYLKAALAPRITRHGVLMEVYGEGLLLIGESGIGKSEAAVELLKRGHRMIADDAVEIRRVSQDSLVGTAPELIRNYVELRGIGIVNVAKLFGMGAVKA